MSMASGTSLNRPSNYVSLPSPYPSLAAPSLDYEFTNHLYLRAD